MEITVAEQISKNLERGELEEFDKKVKSILSQLKSEGQKCTPTQLCGALLKEVEFQRGKVEKLTLSIEEEISNKKKKENREKPEREVINIEFKKNPDAQRFFINIGEFDKVNKSTLMDYICENTETVTRDDFSDSYTKDKFSFFELPKDKVDDVMKNMNGVDLRGREVHVELSERIRRPRNEGRNDYRPRNNSRSFQRNRNSFNDRYNNDKRGFNDRRFSDRRDDRRDYRSRENNGGRRDFHSNDNFGRRDFRRRDDRGERRDFRSKEKSKPRYLDYSSDKRYN